MVPEPPRCLCVLKLSSRKQCQSSREASECVLRSVWPLAEPNAHQRRRFLLWFPRRLASFAVKRVASRSRRERARQNKFTFNSPKCELPSRWQMTLYRRIKLQVYVLFLKKSRRSFFLGPPALSNPLVAHRCTVLSCRSLLLFTRRQWKNMRSPEVKCALGLVVNRRETAGSWWYLHV